ncbi:MAG: hypothetical protein OQJ81_06880 [Melioribacteraceae bacterium]|nr:hypothetical protein [Melioribacteraceae bacterium]
MIITNLVFYFLVLVNSFFLGMIISAVIGMGDSQGLAGGAIILFHGIITGFISLFVSFFLSKNLESKTLKKVNTILLVLFTIFILLFTYRLLSLKNEESKGSALGTTTKIVS